MTGKTLQPDKSKGGRPSVRTPGTETKLIAAFHNGFNDTEACMYAQISRKVFYEWLKRFPEFSDKIKYAKAHPNIKAKELVISNIGEGDVISARWWLERRAKEEFGTRTELTGAGGEPIDSGISEIKKIATGIDKLLGDDNNEEQPSGEGDSQAVS